MLAARIRVTGPFAQFFLSPAGNDANPATQVAPMRTHAALWQYMREDFDFAGKPVQVVHSDGAYPDGIAQWGKLVGDPSSIQWLGNLTNPGACILRPESGHAVKLGLVGIGVVVPVVVNPVRVAPPTRPGYHYAALGLAPALRASKLDALRHRRHRRWVCGRRAA